VAPAYVRDFHAFGRVARGLHLAASGVVRWLLLALVVSGCGFSIETGGPIAGDDEPGMQPDATVTSRMCSTSDQSLRLCIDFDDAADLASDGSMFGHAVRSMNLMPMERKIGEQAVEIDDSSVLYVAETPDLDIPDNLTVSMWIKVDIAGLPFSTASSRWLYDNNTQYFASLRFGGVIRCGSGTVIADSPPLGADGAWHHVACTYKDDEVRVYVDGHVAGCEDTNDRPLPTGGHDGFAIGANLAGGAGAPNFSEQFIGGIDNVQVFSRLLPPAELCGAAGHESCIDSCP